MELYRKRGPCLLTELLRVSLKIGSYRCGAVFELRRRPFSILIARTLSHSHIYRLEDKFSIDCFSLSLSFFFLTFLYCCLYSLLRMSHSVVHPVLFITVCTPFQSFSIPPFIRLSVLSEGSIHLSISSEGVYIDGTQL